MANDDQVAALGGLRPLTQPYGTVKRSYYKLTTSTTIGAKFGAHICKYLSNLLA